MMDVTDFVIRLLLVFSMAGIFVMIVVPLLWSICLDMLIDRIKDCQLSIYQGKEKARGKPEQAEQA